MDDLAASDLQQHHLHYQHQQRAIDFECNKQLANRQLTLDDIAATGENSSSSSKSNSNSSTPQAYRRNSSCSEQAGPGQSSDDSGIESEPSDQFGERRDQNRLHLEALATANRAIAQLAHSSSSSTSTTPDRAFTQATMSQTAAAAAAASVSLYEDGDQGDEDQRHTRLLGQQASCGRPVVDKTASESGEQQRTRFSMIDEGEQEMNENNDRNEQDDNDDNNGPNVNHHQQHQERASSQTTSAASIAREQSAPPTPTSVSIKIELTAPQQRSVAAAQARSKHICQQCNQPIKDRYLIKLYSHKMNQQQQHQRAERTRGGATSRPGVITSKGRMLGVPPPAGDENSNSNNNNNDDDGDQDRAKDGSGIDSDENSLLLHENCLKCSICNRLLNKNCFVWNTKLYCPQDYYK